jgi:hypothetical protein
MDSALKVGAQAKRCPWDPIEDPRPTHCIMMIRTDDNDNQYEHIKGKLSNARLLIVSHTPRARIPEEIPTGRSMVF